VRRLILIVTAGCIALGLVAVTALSAVAETSTTQQPSGDASAPKNTNTYDVEAQAAFISQGSAIGATSAELAAVRADVAVEESLPDYSQVVDNDNGERFSAPGWHEGGDGSGVGQVSYGGSYVRSGSEGQPASFQVDIPTSNDYTVYAWWPAFSDNSEAAHFGIDTAAGRQWTSVDQTRDGGIWIKLGTYAMSKGERTIQLSAGDTVADAVAVVRGDVTIPPDDGENTATRQADTYSATAVRNPTRHDIVRVARRWMSTPYRYAACTQYRMSCTCETKKTYRRFGHRLSMIEARQWRYRHGAWKIRHRSNLRQGDEVFFKENGPYKGITHVGVFSGNGNLVHASVYYGKVVESKMKYINGYFGAKRYRLNK
jgi:cell wall-associated NlpC family hydrolase